jgi:hypothetical protein
VTPLSPDPAKRARQLRNLRKGGPPAPRGNTWAVTHGATAKIARDRLEAKEREVFDAVAADAPLRNGDGSLPAADGVLVRLLAEALCRLDSIGSYLRDHGLIDPKTGQPRSVLEIEGRIRREAADYAEALAMSPRSRVKLGVALVQAASAAGEEEAAAARAARERLDRRLEGLDPLAAGAAAPERERHRREAEDDQDHPERHVDPDDDAGDSDGDHDRPGDQKGTLTLERGHGSSVAEGAE